jgi:MFS family permease
LPCSNRIEEGQGKGFFVSRKEWNNEPDKNQTDGDFTPLPSRGWARSFNSLKNRDFRWFLISLLGFFNGMQMGVVARGWLVYTLTDSPLALGVVSAGWGLPLILFSLFGGFVADRVPKRNLMIITQGAVCLLSMVMAALISTGLIRLWHLVLASILSGIILAFSLPARQAFISEVAGHGDLLNAVALNSVVMNVCRIVSPALAGILLKLIGIPGVYWIVVISYGLGVILLTRIRPRAAPAQSIKISSKEEFLLGLRYVRSHDLLFILMLIAFVPIVVALPYEMLMPVFARDVFRAGATGLGLLMSAAGGGALIGSAFVSTLGNFRHKGMLMLVAGMIFGGFLIFFSQSGSLKMACLFLLFSSGGGSVLYTLTNTLIMGHTPEELVGRVMSLYMITWGLMPLGVLPAGALAEVFGAPLVVTAGGAILVVFMLGVIIVQPKLRALN